MTRKQLVLLGTLLLMVLVVILLLISARDNPAPAKMIFISGVPTCSKNIDPVIVENLGDTLYAYVATANDYNKASMLPTYQAEVRADSCREEKSHTVIPDNGNKLDVYTSSITVDIPDAKQSWRMRYDWTEKGYGLSVDLGMPVPTCLVSAELRYGDFNCDKVLNIYKYGTPDYDPIQKYMPYTGEGFSLTYTSQSHQVIATITIPSKQKDNQELIENNKAVIPYWFQKHNLDMSKYIVVYRVLYE